MDGGWENYALIALFTRRGWVGNVLFDDPDQKIGSDFEVLHEEAITLRNLNDIEEAAKRALGNMEKNGLASSVLVETVNRSAQIRETRIRITAPGGEEGELLITNNGLNWLIQATDPAHLKV